jgi:hypothetical protein
MEDADAEGGGAGEIADLDADIVAVYKGVGKLLTRYKSGSV